MLVFTNGQDLPESQIREQERFDDKMRGSGYFTTNGKSKRKLAHLQDSSPPSNSLASIFANQSVSAILYCFSD